MAPDRLLAPLPGQVYGLYPYSPMFPRINPSSGVPLFRQIVKEMHAAYLQGLIQPDEQVPSVREMASRLGINPTTVVKAYDCLENEGLIVRRQGQGAFVVGQARPLRPGERGELLSQLASDLAIEGRRLGVSESQLVEILRGELKRLRPRKAR